MSLTLCSITRNEENFIGGCLQSVEGLVDQVIIVDTGSTDDTRKVATGLRADVVTFCMDGDFSAARNIALARAEGEWILVLDADERLDARSHHMVRELISRDDAEPSAYLLWRYNIFGTGTFYTDQVVRLFRNDRQIRYSGAVAESVLPSIDQMGRSWQAAEVVVNHLGFTRSRKVRDAKARRYLGMLEGRLRAGERNPYLEIQIALILRRLGRYDEAVALVRGCLETNASSDLAFLGGHVFRSAGNVDEALASFERCVALDPNNSPALNMVGVMHMTLGNDDAAESAYLAADAHTTSLCHQRLNLGLLREFQGRFREAAELFDGVRRTNPFLALNNRSSRCEADPHRNVSSESAYGYAGLLHHLGFNRYMAAGIAK